MAQKSKHLASKSSLIITLVLLVVGLFAAVVLVQTNSEYRSEARGGNPGQNGNSTDICRMRTNPPVQALNIGYPITLTAKPTFRPGNEKVVEKVTFSSGISNVTVSPGTDTTKPFTTSMTATETGEQGYVTVTAYVDGTIACSRQVRVVPYYWQ